MPTDPPPTDPWANSPGVDPWPTVWSAIGAWCPNAPAYDYIRAAVERALAAERQQATAQQEELETRLRVQDIDFNALSSESYRFEERAKLYEAEHLLRVTAEAEVASLTQRHQAELTRAVLRYTVKGFTAGENTDAKAWRQRAEQAEATVRALQQQQTWQPIATAPKDADIWLLLWEPSGVGIGAYVDFGATVPEGYHHGWFASMGGHYELHPTHWMPLPNAPVQEPLDAD